MSSYSLRLFVLLHGKSASTSHSRWHNATIAVVQRTIDRRIGTTVRGLHSHTTGAERQVLGGPSLSLTNTQEKQQQWFPITTPTRRRRTRRFISIFSDQSKGKTGLFGLPRLRQPQDYQVLAREAMEEANQLVETALQKANTIRSNLGKNPDGTVTEDMLNEAKELLYVLDKISDTVCKIVDSAELCRNVHADPTWRQEAEKTFSTLLNFIFELNTKPELYDSLCTVTKNKKILQQLSSEQQRVALLLQHEFERDGIHLPEDARRRQVQLSNKASHLGMEFSRNISNAFSLFPIGPVKQLRNVEVLRDFLAGKSDDEWVELPADTGLCNRILKLVENENIRKMTKKAMYESYADNIPVLHQLIESRRELAELIGFRSYSDFVMFDRMAGCPEEVIEILHRLSSKVRKKALAEYVALQRAKRIKQSNGSSQMTGIWLPLNSNDLQELSSIDGKQSRRKIDGYDTKGYWDDGQDAENEQSLHNPPIYTWDASYYREQLQKEWFDFDHSSLKPYLSLGNMVDGITFILHRVFGIKLHELDVDDNEAWDCGVSGSPSRIRKFALIHEHDGPLGTIYLDMFSRSNKYPGAAHFVVQCGKKLSSEDRGSNESADSAVVSPGNNIQSVGEFQMPIVSLVMSFQPKDFSIQQEKDFLLSPAEMETLFHEFGHALHSLLSRTDFQHVSGTRSALDFVELPSHLFEYFASDWRVIRNFAKHYRTGEIIPKSLLEKYNFSKRAFSATDIQSQIINALLDQALYSSNPNSVACSSLETSEGDKDCSEGEKTSVYYKQRDGSSTKTPGRDTENIDSVVLFQEIEQRHSFIQPLPGLKVPGCFSHLVNYGAGYYSYL